MTANVESQGAEIRLYFCDIHLLSTEEFERLAAEVKGRVLAGDAGISDRVLCQLLYEHYSRYHEAVLANGGQPNEETKLFCGELAEKKRKVKL
jgi:hypothetical protein